MSYSQLLSLLRPPEEPIETGSAEGWAAVEAMLSTTLPEDYKQFIGNFGSGWLGGFLFVWNPFASAFYMNFETRYVWKLGSLEGEPLPYPLYPASGGLLPFAATKDGDTLFWVTQAQPDHWTIFILPARGSADDYDEYAMDFTTFLCKLLKFEIHGRTISSTSLELFKVSEPTG
ncbi:MAG: hypothetical protein GC204_17550 [Chloroflexi bacterium]|nr:hypothetical protein [Chloroflexota bacterium]